MPLDAYNKRVLSHLFAWSTTVAQRIAFGPFSKPFIIEHIWAVTNLSFSGSIPNRFFRVAIAGDNIITDPILTGAQNVLDTGAGSDDYIHMTRLDVVQEIWPYKLIEEVPKYVKAEADYGTLAGAKQVYFLIEIIDVDQIITGKKEAPTPLTPEQEAAQDTEENRLLNLIKSKQIAKLAAEADLATNPRGRGERENALRDIISNLTTEIRDLQTELSVLRRAKSALRPR